MNDGLGMIRELSLTQDKKIFLRKKKELFAQHAYHII